MTNNISERIRAYWNSRAEGFANTRRYELSSDYRENWLAEITKLIGGHDTPLRILDVGTGAGFFAVLLAGKGHDVTGIDLSEEMIASAKKLALECGASAEFLVMDAQETSFADESFDVVVTRNLTWTLPDARKAYGDWVRVLKTGGILINFDADYGKVCFEELTENLDNKGVENAHRNLGGRVLGECDAIKEALKISGEDRPQWDCAVLSSLGCTVTNVDTEISSRLYSRVDAAWNPVPMFAVCAKKN